MKNSLTNPVRYRKTIVVEALLLTLIIHALFFVIFSVPERKAGSEQKYGADMILIHTKHTQKFHDSADGHIYEYNPTHFINSSSPAGFSTFLKPHRLQEKVPGKLADNELHLSMTDAGIEYNVLPQNKDINLSLIRTVTKPAAPVTAGSYKYPFAVSSSGRIIQFNIDKKNIPAGNPPAQTAVFKLINKKNGKSLPRFITLRNSGHRVYDRICLQQLYLQGDKFNEFADGETFTVYYSEAQEANAK